MTPNSLFKRLLRERLPVVACGGIALSLREPRLNALRNFSHRVIVLNNCAATVLVWHDYSTSEMHIGTWRKLKIRFLMNEDEVVSVLKRLLFGRQCHELV